MPPYLRKDDGKMKRQVQISATEPDWNRKRARKVINDLWHRQLYRVQAGDQVKIGANVVVLQNISAGATGFGIFAKIMRRTS